MPVIRNTYPILEYDTENEGIIKPNRHGRGALPPICIVTFFGEVLDAFVSKNQCEIRNQYGSEMKGFPVYVFQYKGIELCLIQAVVGSASIAMMADFLFGYGVKTIIACGGCGVLDSIPAGDVIIPTAALRDEGASYHYLPPSREIHLDAEVIKVIEDTLVEFHVPFMKCKTWTTDGFYRETPDMVAYRMAEGCGVVEMECAAIASVARFRGAKFGQLLYSGDILANFSKYDERNWSSNLTAREKLFYLSLEIVIRLYRHA